MCESGAVRLLLYTHPACREHDTGGWHPERPARLEAALEGARRGADEVVECEAPQASVEALETMHRPSYIARVRDFCLAGGGSLDPDTVVSSGSWDAALRAAGAGLAAMEALERGEGDAAFLAVRPPGHHATRDRAMGFCLFNNIAITADALARRGNKVAIVDWDVHHGNATQDMFYDRRDVLYISDLLRGRVLAIDAAADTVVASAAVDHNLNTLKVSPDGERLFACSRGPNNPVDWTDKGPAFGKLYCLDPLTLAVTDWTWGGNQPTGLAISPDGSSVCFSDFLDARLEVYDLPPAGVVPAAIVPAAIAPAASGR